MACNSESQNNENGDKSISSSSEDVHAQTSLNLDSRVKQINKIILRSGEYVRDLMMRPYDTQEDLPEMDKKKLKAAINISFTIGIVSERARVQLQLQIRAAEAELQAITEGQEYVGNPNTLRSELRSARTALELLTVQINSKLGTASS